MIQSNQRSPRPDVQVPAKAKRRRFSAQYKLGILEQAEACTKPGERGALLRREGLYSSHLTEWRKARKRGELEALTPKKRGRKPNVVDPRDRRIAELERALTKERARRERAEGLVEIQKKLATLLGQPMEGETP